jgi:membrane protease YdiL (CAAX protease family)
MADNTFIKRNQMLVFYVLAFAISWILILLIIGPIRFIGTENIPDVLLPMLYVAMLAGPSISGILLTGLVDGKAGLLKLLSQLLNWRVNALWYIVALLIAPLLTTAILLVLSIISVEFFPTILISNNKFGLLLTSIVVGLVVGFFEELGWTGYAIPRLRMRHSILSTGLLMGFLWGAWHFPLFSGSANSSGSIPSTLYVAALLFSWLPAYRVLMVWIYNRTHSLLISILMHLPIVLSQFVLIPPTLSGASLLTFDLVWSAVLWIVIAGIAIIDRRQLSLQKPVD